MSRTLSTNFNIWALSSRCRNRRSPQIVRCVHAATAFEGTSPATDRQPPVNPFPYPTHRNPTPHQLFHLPTNATKSEIKARYYDLVRFYHPDKVSDTTDPTVALTRFRAITAAYDVLRGKAPLKEGLFNDEPSDSEARYRTTASYRAMRQKRQELYNSGAVDDSGKDKLIIAGLLFTIAFVVIHTSLTRREAMAAVLGQNRSLPSERRHRQEPQEDHRLSQDPQPRPNDPTTEGHATRGLQTSSADN